MKHALHLTTLAAVVMIAAPTLSFAQATAGASSGANASAGGNLATGNANYSTDENSKAAADKQPMAVSTSSATMHHRSHALRSSDNAMPDNSPSSATNANMKTDVDAR